MYMVKLYLILVINKKTAYNQLMSKEIVKTLIMVVNLPAILVFLRTNRGKFKMKYLKNTMKF